MGRRLSEMSRIYEQFELDRDSLKNYCSRVLELNKGKVPVQTTHASLTQLKRDLHSRGYHVLCIYSDPGEKPVFPHSIQIGGDAGKPRQADFNAALKKAGLEVLKFKPGNIYTDD